VPPDFTGTFFSVPKPVVLSPGVGGYVGSIAGPSGRLDKESFETQEGEKKWGKTEFQKGGTTYGEGRRKKDRTGCPPLTSILRCQKCEGTGTLGHTGR